MKKCSFICLISTAALLAGCYSEPDNLRLLDDLVVATNFDPAADFKTYASFAMPTDTIGYISNSSNDTIITSSESTFPRPVLAAIRENLLARGYTRVDRTENPDLGINVVVVNDFNVFQQVIYPDPYGYPGTYYPGYYGYGSYYYYPYINTYAYNTGVLIIEIVDLKNMTPDNRVKVIWDAYMGDLYSTIDRIPQTERAIDQAFEQSPNVSRDGE